MAFPVCVSAQDDDMDDEEVVVRTVKKKQKQYDTRVVRGEVVSATTGLPIAGALVSADGIDGYSVLTEDDGTYEVKATSSGRTTTQTIHVRKQNPAPIQIAVG